MQQSNQPATAQTLVGISLENAFRAQEVLVASGLVAAGRLKLEDAVTVAKDDAGKTAVPETIDPSPARSALSGAMWAGLFGLVLGGPVGWIAGVTVGAGAGAGAVTAKVADLGVPDEWATRFRDAVQLRTATVALLVEDLDRDAFVAETTRFTGAELGVCQPRRRNQRTGQGRLLRPRTGHPQQPLKPTAACAVVQASAHPSAKHERERSALTISTGAPIPRSRDPRVAQRLTGVVQ